LLGDEPQPITRVFSLQNTGTGDQTGTLDLVCLADTTSSTSSSTFTSSQLSSTAGQTVYYRITVTNTGNTDLTFSNFTDSPCDAGTIAGGPGSGTLAPGDSATYTCDHVLTSADVTAGSYSNTASVTGTPPSGDGSAITSSSNTVVVDTSGSQPHFAFRLARNQVGPRVRSEVTLSGAGSRVELDAYSAGLGGGSLAHATRGVLLGRAVRPHAAGHVRLLVSLNAAGRRALARRHRLQVMLILHVRAAAGATQTLIRSVTLTS
jgi:uncharacterized repeat protein (TIGR01451 family)